MQERFKISVQRSCRLAQLARSVWYAKSRARDQSALCQRIRDIAMSRPRFGYLRVLVMLKREGWQVGKKRVYRLYRQQGLQLRMKVKRRKRIALLRGRPQTLTGPNQHWSMDFVHDQMLDGRAFRILTVIDQWSRRVCAWRPTSGCPGDAWAKPWTGLHHSVDGPRQLLWTTALSSHPRPWTSGHIAGASSSITPVQASPRTMG
jgi:putative transposase